MRFKNSIIYGCLSAVKATTPVLIPAHERKDSAALCVSTFITVPFTAVQSYRKGSFPKSSHDLTTLCIFVPEGQSVRGEFDIGSGLEVRPEHLRYWQETRYTLLGGTLVNFATLHAVAASTAMHILTNSITTLGCIVRCSRICLEHGNIWEQSSTKTLVSWPRPKRNIGAGSRWRSSTSRQPWLRGGLRRTG